MWIIHRLLGVSFHSEEAKVAPMMYDVRGFHLSPHSSTYNQACTTANALKLTFKIDPRAPSILVSKMRTNETSNPSLHNRRNDLGAW